MKILLWRLHSLICSKPSTQTSATANLFIPPGSAGQPSEKMSFTSELLAETHFEGLPWFKEVEILQLSRLLLLKDSINARRKLHHAQSKQAFWAEQEKIFVHGEGLFEDGRDSESLAAEIGELSASRDLVLEEFPDLCHGAVHCSTDEVIYEQSKLHADKCRELIEKKNRVLSLLTYQLTVYKAIEYLSRRDAQGLKEILPDINFMHNQLSHLEEGQHTRQTLYEEKASLRSKDPVTHNDAYLRLFGKFVNPGVEMLQLVDGLIGDFPDFAEATDRMNDAPQELTPLRRLQNPAPVFSPQPSLSTTPGGFTDGLSPLRLTPLSSLHDPSTEPSLHDTCGTLDKLFKTRDFLLESADKFARSSDQSIMSKNALMTEELGKLYSLIFSERNSSEPTVSTSTILDNFEGASSLTHTIEADRVRIQEEFMRTKMGIRRDIGKSERRSMMCAFFSDPRNFFAKYLKKMQEAEKYQLTIP